MTLLRQTRCPGLHQRLVGGTCYLFAVSLTDQYFGQMVFALVSLIYRSKILTDKTGEPGPFSLDDLAQSAYPDMPMEIQPLDNFLAFTKETRNPKKHPKAHK